MGYCFAGEDASVEEGFRRIARELLAKTIRLVDDLEAETGDLNGDGTIHRLRKGCKKLRGLYRLVRPGFSDYARENAAIRDAAAGLSSARDAEVLVKTFDALVGADASVPDGVAAVRKRLAIRSEELARGDNAAAALASFRAAMVAARKRAKHWKLEGKGFGALSEGLETSFASARKAMQHARKDPSAEVFHEWRKRAKDHWYHSRLLAPIWPDLLNTHVKLAEDLGEQLGFHHDLSVFREAVGGATDDGKVAAFLDAQAERRAAEVAAECFALGNRLLAEEPAALSRRWRAYWKCWRVEQRAPEPVG